MPIFQNHTTGNSPHSNSQSIRKISFSELDYRSKVLARILRDTGCQQGAPIVCVMNNSIDFLIALGGIKYAGGLALPVSPDQPVSLIQSFILENNAAWLIVDRSAKPLLSLENLRQGSLNIAWMDATEQIPENCFPEFVRDNIDHIPMGPVYPEPDKAEPVVTFHTFENTQLKKNTFTQENIEKVTSSILEILKLHSDSKIAGLMSCNSPSVLLGIMSLFQYEPSLFLFDQEYHAESFVKEINELQMTHLLLESEIVEKFSSQIHVGNVISRNVDEVVLWGEELSKKMLNGLKLIFPNATVYSISVDQDKNISAQIDDHSTTRFINIANIPNQTEKAAQPVEIRV